MTLLKTVNKKHKCNVAFIKVISKVILSKYREQNFNLRYGRSFVSHTSFLTEKLPNLKLKTRHIQLLASLPHSPVWSFNMLVFLDNPQAYVESTYSGYYSINNLQL